MRSLKIPVQSFILILICVIGFSNVSAQQLGKIKGSVTDQFDAVVVGVEVNLTGETSPARKTLTNQTGNFFFDDVSPGKYTLTVKAAGFKTYENSIEINQGSTLSLDLKLEVALDNDIQVVVDPDREPGIDNANQVILKGKNLDVLPDDPEALLSSLQALTGGGQTSLDGGAQIYVDGFVGTVPPKSSILEVRINQNQLNAEFDRAGFGRIDIITKPGAQKLTGSAYFNVSDDALVARNPFVPVREPYQTRLYGFNISKALKPNKLAFTLDVQKRDEDTNTVVNSRILNQIFEPVIFSTAVPTPLRLTVINPRFDIKLNKNNYLIARYTFTRTEIVNRGVGDFLLPERGYPIANDQNVFQITESSILNPKVSNEFRFQFVNDSVKQFDENTSPGISVQDAFVSGGAGIGLASTSARRWEIQNYTNAIFKGHTFRFGVRLRGVSIKDTALTGYNGLFSFTGRIAPQLNSNNEIILDQQGNPILTQISSLESYRRTLLFQNAGLSPQEIRRRGGGASLFTISVGNPEAKLNQIDIGVFFQDEWRIRPNLSVGVGLRYENQQNLSSHFNFAPRLFFAWSPGNKTPPDLIIRGGFGIFYDRLAESPTLLARRFDGITQIRYFITDPSILDSFPNLPSPSALGSFTGNQSQTRVDENLRAPYSTTGILNIEKTLPFKIQGYIYAYAYRTYNVIRQRNINAPLPGTFVAPTMTNPGSPGIRPNPNLGEIFFYESSGNFSLNQATFGIRKFFKNGNFLFSSYILGHVKSDSEGFPADSYNLKAESADASFDVRHRFIFGGSFTVPKIKVLLSPFLIASSGRPFNVTTGIDNNGDRIYTDRPAFAANTTLPENLRNTEFGSFDLRPLPGQEMIPRNYGRGPAFFSVNLNLSRTFDLNPWKTKKLKANQNPQANQNPADSKSGVNQFLDKAYKLTLLAQIQNLFNRTNLDVPNGNLSSPLFGQSVRIVPSFGSGTPAGFNRRIEFGLRLNF